MARHIRFLVFQESHKPVRQFSISRPFIGFLMLGALVSTSAVGLVLKDYKNLRQKRFNVAALHHTIARQEKQLAEQKVCFTKAFDTQQARFTEQLEAQQARFDALEQDYAVFESRLMALTAYETKIREAAGFPDHQNAAKLNGMGGPIPEDKVGAGFIAPEEPLNQGEEIDQALQHGQNRFEDLLKKLTRQFDHFAKTPSIRPSLGRITSRFGKRASPFSKKREFHQGLDIAAPAGTVIYAAADGKVVKSFINGAFGKFIEIDHGNGFVTRYGHNKTLLKKKGAKVKKGEPIAIMGSTGRSTGRHLHYEVIINGIHVNPGAFFMAS